MLSQDPAPGTEVAPDSAVSYVESLGVETVAVPDLAGPAADAPDTITAAGLSVGDAGQAYSDTVPSGEVLSQIPPPAPRSRPAARSATSSPSASRPWPCPTSRAPPPTRPTPSPPPASRR